MVFSSAPLYLDPHNWHHHQQNQQAQLHQHQQPLHQQQNQQLSVITHGVGGGENPHHHQLAVQTPPTAPPSQALGSGSSSSSIRPGSMAERAREAKIPHPEPGLKCPRCESTNTKFCYFNNYNLTQPRHFCKMCRRYWTRGGALRNVPVGGGCRRNKRSGKGGGASKATGGGGERQIGTTGPSNNSTSPISSNSNNTEMNKNNGIHGSMVDTTSLSGQTFGTRLTQFPLLASLQGLTHGQYGSQATSLGLNFGEMMSTAAQGELGFQIGASSGNSTDQWRPYHFPNFLAGFDPPQQQVPQPQPPPSSTLYHQFPIDHQSMDLASANNQVPSRSSIISGMNQQYVRASQLSNNSTEHKNNNYEASAAVKAEGSVSQGGMNLLSRSFLGMSESSQYSVGNNNNNNSTWTDMSGLNSSTN